MLKFFKFPWAITGTRTAIPATDPGTGEMNYQTGYPAPYQLPKTDPASRNIERDKFNELQYDITNELRLLQAYGVPDFITTALNEGVPFPYDVGATCMYLGRQYISRKTANTSLPSVAADWSLVLLGGIPKATAGGTANAVTADFVPDVGTLVDGQQLLIQHTAANTLAVTINPDGAGAIATYKGAGLPLAAGDIPGADYWGLYVYDASVPALQMLNPATGITLANGSVTPAKLSQPYVSGATIPLGAGAGSAVILAAGIPAYVTQFTVALDAVSTTGVDLTKIQLGTGAGFVTAGYQSSASTGASSVPTTSTTGALISYRDDAANTTRGNLIFTRVGTSNLWTWSGSTSGAGTSLGVSGLGGSINLPGPLTQVRIITADAYDGTGTGSLSYQ